MLKIGDTVFLDPIECSYFSGVAVFHGKIGIFESMVGKDFVLHKIKVKED